ncbi:MAG: trypsin-like peptidase domain-containing protein [bacterium]
MKRFVIGTTMLGIFVVGSIGGGIVGAGIAVKQMKPVLDLGGNQKNPGEQSVIPVESAKTIARAEESAAISVAKSAGPSVVSISISKDISLIRQSNPFDSFDQFFNFGIPKIVPKVNPKSEPDAPAETQKQKIGGGTGFVVTSDGIIVTNKHVAADDNADYTVTTSDGHEYPAKILARDPVVDVAILKIDAKNLPVLQFGDSDDIQIGQTVIAIGNALAELANTVTKGVVSGVNRRVEAGGAGMSEIIEEAIQTDAAINPGNSGGPLLDLDGRVIGMNTAINQGGQSLGFSIPSNVINRIVKSVEKNGRIVRSWLGVRYVLLEQKPELAKAVGVEHGALILSGNPGEVAIVPGSPAEKAGLKERDVVTKVNAALVNGDHSLSSLLSKFSPGDVVSLTIVRQGKEMPISITLGEFDEKVVAGLKK